MSNNPTPGLNMDSFIDVMNDYVEKNHIKLLLDCPEGTQDVNIVDGINPFLNFFITSLGMIAAMKDLKKELASIDCFDWSKTLDALLEEIKKELL